MRFCTIHKYYNICISQINKFILGQMRTGVYSVPKYLNNFSSFESKKWPQDIECIIKSQDPSKGSLYLSNVEAASNPSTVKQLRVGAILSCAKGYMLSHPTQLVPYYKYIPGEDKQTFDISLHLEDAVEFIYNALQRTNIIVHCIAGVSRSASMVIAYFMKHKNLTFNQAFAQVKAKRKIISPNDGFIMHLKQFQEKLSFQLRQANRKSFNQENSFYERSLSGQFYSPTKKYNYQQSYDLSKSSAKNPQSIPQENIYRRYQYHQDKKYQKPQGFDSIINYKTQSMTLIPQQNRLSPRNSTKHDKFKNVSNQLSPKKTVTYTTQKPRLLARDTIYQTANNNRQNSGYFDSMNNQLNQKIEAIRKKYEQQRKVLMSSHPSVKEVIQKAPLPHYVDLKPKYRMSAAYTDRKEGYKQQGKKDMLGMFDKTMNLRTSPRFSNFDEIYVPKITSGHWSGYLNKQYN